MNSGKQQKSRKEIIYFLLTFITIVTIATFTVPKIATKIFPQARRARLDTFIATVLKENKIDEQVFWEFREFYSPGFVHFSKVGLDVNMVRDVESALNPEVNRLNPFLLFESPYLKSVDSLTDETRLGDLIDTGNLNSKKVIFKDETSVILEGTNGWVFLAFLKPSQQLKNANGFFDEEGIYDSSTENKHWLNITVINP